MLLFLYIAGFFLRYKYMYLRKLFFSSGVDKRKRHDYIRFSKLMSFSVVRKRMGFGSRIPAIVWH